MGDNDKCVDSDADVDTTMEIPVNTDKKEELLEFAVELL
jgi:hypothetical protein